VPPRAFANHLASVVFQTASTHSMIIIGFMACIVGILTDLEIYFSVKFHNLCAYKKAKN
jgi:hypothetical protein